MVDVSRIKGDDPWVKAVDMLQQNWASIESEGDGARVFFINDNSVIFDSMFFSSEHEAVIALTRNRFRKFLDNPDLQSFLPPPPRPPFYQGCDSARKIDPVRHRRVIPAQAAQHIVSST